MRVKKVNIFKDIKLEIFNSIEFFIFTKIWNLKENAARARNGCGWSSFPRYLAVMELKLVFRASKLLLNYISSVKPNNLVRLMHLLVLIEFLNITVPVGVGGGQKTARVGKTKKIPATLKIFPPPPSG